MTEKARKQAAADIAAGKLQVGQHHYEGHPLVAATPPPESDGTFRKFHVALPALDPQQLMQASLARMMGEDSPKWLQEVAGQYGVDALRPEVRLDKMPAKERKRFSAPPERLPLADESYFPEPVDGTSWVNTTPGYDRQSITTYAQLLEGLQPPEGEGGILFPYAKINRNAQPGNVPNMASSPNFLIPELRRFGETDTRFGALDPSGIASTILGVGTPHQGVSNMNYTDQMLRMYEHLRDTNDPRAPEVLARITKGIDSTNKRINAVKEAAAKRQGKDFTPKDPFYGDRPAPGEDPLPWLRQYLQTRYRPTKDGGRVAEPTPFDVRTNLWPVVASDANSRLFGLPDWKTAVDATTDPWLADLPGAFWAGGVAPIFTDQQPRPGSSHGVDEHMTYTHQLTGPKPTGVLPYTFNMADLLGLGAGGPMAATKTFDGARPALALTPEYISSILRGGKPTPTVFGGFNNATNVRRGSLREVPEFRPRRTPAVAAVGEPGGAAVGGLLGGVPAPDGGPAGPGLRGGASLAAPRGGQEALPAAGAVAAGPAGPGGVAAGDAAGRVAPEFDPAASNTQRAITTATYAKAAASGQLRGKVLDMGAGMGLGADAMRSAGLDVDTAEPFPDNWSSKTQPDGPTHRRTENLPDGSYDSITNFSVLNVLKPDVRDHVVGEIGRLLKPGGTAIITARDAADVNSAKGKVDAGLEPGGWRIKDQYQKGFTPKELVDYLQRTLGEGFEVKPGKGMNGASAIIAKKGQVNPDIAGAYPGGGRPEPRPVAPGVAEFQEDVRLQAGNRATAAKGPAQPGGPATFDAEGAAGAGAALGPGDMVALEKERASAPASSAAAVLARLEQATLTTPEKTRELLGSDRMPEYLQGVTSVIVHQRNKLLSGQLTPRDVAKALYMTLASQGSGANRVESQRNAKGVVTQPGFTDKTGIVPDAMYTDKNAKGEATIRPEEAAAAWLFTPNGQKALNAIEQGVFDPEAWSEGAGVRKSFGDDRFGTLNAFGPLRQSGQYNFTNIGELTAAINAARGDVPTIEKILSRVNGIGAGKLGFIKHMIGLGDSPTIDAVEINHWLAGQGDIGSSTTPGAQLAREVKAASSDKRVGGLLGQRITEQFAKLREMGVGADIPEDVFNHVMHHWIWDKAKGLETTHAGMYHALLNAKEADGGVPEPTSRPVTTTRPTKTDSTGQVQVNPDGTVAMAASDPVTRATAPIKAIIDRLSAKQGRDLDWLDRLTSPLSQRDATGKTLRRGTYETLGGEAGAKASDLFREHQAASERGDMEALGKLGGDIQKAAEDIRNGRGTPGNTPLPGLADEMVSHLADIEGLPKPYEDAIGRVLQSLGGDKTAEPHLTTRRTAAAITSIHSLLKLKAVPRSAIVNRLQPLETLWPYVTTSDYMKMAAQAEKPAEWQRLQKLGVLDGPDKAMEGEIARRTTPEITGRKALFREAVVNPFGTASSANRVMGYLYGEMDAKRKGITDPEMIHKNGMAWAEVAEFDNSAYNAPPILRDTMGKVLLQFKGFTVKSLENLFAPGGIFAGDIGGQSAATRAGRIAKWGGQKLATGGLKSLTGPMPALAVAAYTALRGNLEAKGMSQDEADKLAQAVLLGAPALAGIDISSSVGVLDPPFGDTPDEQLINFLGGPTVGAGKAIKEGIGGILTGPNPVQSGYDMLKSLSGYPKMLEGAVSTYGALTGRPQQEWVNGKRSDMTLGESVAKTAGFSSARAATGREIQDEVKDLRSQYAELLYNRWLQGASSQEIAKSGSSKRREKDRLASDYDNPETLRAKIRELQREGARMPVFRAPRQLTLPERR
jgi:SAM-dependent methyltransferase